MYPGRSAGKQSVIVAWPYTPADMEALELTYVVHRLWEADDRTSFLKEVGRGVRAFATDGERGVDAATMDLLPDLRIIASFGVGLDAIDLEYARAKGIRVTHTPDVLTGDVADMAIGLLLACARRIPQGDAHVRAGRWPANGPSLTTRVFGKRLGILGLGRVGRAVAQRARAFGLDIAYYDRERFADVDYRYCDSVVSLALGVDFLMICASAEANTRSIVGRDVLDALGENGFLVNVARGSIVDEPALLDCLRDRRIAGAALDVFYNEPRIAEAFFELDNVVLQPHQSSATFETRAAMGALVRDNLAAFFAGAPLLTEVRRMPPG